MTQLPKGDDRQYWLNCLDRVAGPVLRTAAEGRLRATMPCEQQAGSDRRDCTHLEALGRTLAGIGPWLALGEGDLCDEYRRLSIAAIESAMDRDSPDHLRFDQSHQSLVDAAFVAQGILRAPGPLWEALPPVAQDRLIAALRASRRLVPAFSNWLLFSATIEAALFRCGADDWDRVRIDYALRQHEQWYVGDGHYGDGPRFHADYYNSFVIQPMLVDILTAVGEEHSAWSAMREPVQKRLTRYAAVLERMISPEGTFPPIGRSITYRFGALQALAQAALLDLLPAEVSPAQVRGAMTAVLRRLMDVTGNFDADGWLTIGLGGHQPGLGERYISTGSLYLFCSGFLPLGLPSSHAFWADPPAPWTQQRVWGGDRDVRADHAV